MKRAYLYLFLLGFFAQYLACSSPTTSNTVAPNPTTSPGTQTPTDTPSPTPDPNASPTPTTPPGSGKTYAVGYDTVNSHSVMRYWVDGSNVTNTLDSNTDSAWNIFVSGTTIYIAGYEMNGSIKRAKYWVNNTGYLIGNGTSESSGVAIYVVGSDIYVAGWEKSGSTPIAKFWKNGTETVLGNAFGNYESKALSINVTSGGDVYLGGYQSKSNGTKVACYWKNSGTGTSIGEDQTRDSLSQSIVVEGTDVYSAGYQVLSSGKKRAVYWVNTAANYLSDSNYDGEATGIYRATNTYVSGYEFTQGAVLYSKACYWVNSNSSKTCMTDGVDTESSAAAYGISVYGSYIYLAGSAYKSSVPKAFLWRNGTATNLTPSSSGAAAYGIFVK